MNILVIIGPSGSGKSTIAKQLHKEGLVQFVPTWTTRPIRPDEQENVDHVFVSKATFEKAELKGTFLLTLRPFGLKYMYGLVNDLKHYDGVVCILLREQIVGEFLNFFPEAKVYNIYSSKNIAASRIKNRSPNEHIGTRIEQFEDEVKKGNKIADRQFINSDNYEVAYEKIKQSVLKDFDGKIVS